MTSGSLSIEFNSDVEININLIKDSKVNSFGLLLFKIILGKFLTHSVGIIK
jgi:hypothetical protein